MAVTGAELYISGASWAFQAKLMDPERRGEYSGVAEVFSTLGGRWAPALFTLLAMSWHPAAASRGRLAGDRGHRGPSPSIGLHPAVRMAERFLEREGIAPVGCDRRGRGAAPRPSPDEDRARRRERQLVG